MRKRNGTISVMPTYTACVLGADLQGCRRRRLLGSCDNQYGNFAHKRGISFYVVAFLQLKGGGGKERRPFVRVLPTRTQRKSVCVSMCVQSPPLFPAPSILVCGGGEGERQEIAKGGQIEAEKEEERVAFHGSLPTCGSRRREGRKTVKEDFDAFSPFQHGYLTSFKKKEKRKRPKSKYE